MKRAFTLLFWQNDEWFAGKLKEVPGVFSQGETLKELEENIEDAYRLMMEEDIPINSSAFESKEIFVEAGRNAEILSSNSLRPVAF